MLEAIRSNLTRKLPEIIYYLAVAALLATIALSSAKVLGVDGISYLTVAEQYANGHWKEAVNGYWSPLLSWLLAPFIAAGVSGEVAYRILLVACGIAILLLGQHVVNRYTEHKALATVIYQVSMISFLVYVMQYLVMTDPFVTLWSLALATILASAPNPFGKSKKWLLALGAFGAIGFLTKVILLPIFVLVVAVWFLLFSSAPKRYRLLDRGKRLLLPLIGLALVASIWVIPLSTKFGKLTLGESGKYSMAYIGPHSIGHPITHGLLAPSEPFAVSPWLDPSRHAYIPWSPLDSLDDFQYYLDLIFTKNIPEIFNVLNQMSPFIVGVLWVAIVLLALKRVPPSKRPIIAASVLISIVVLSAYATSHVSGGDRYLWPVLVLTVIMIAIFLGSFRARGRKSQIMLWATALLFPLLSFSHWKPIHSDHPAFYKLSEAVKNRVSPQSRFASNSLDASDHVAFYADLIGYGATLSGRYPTDPLVKADLQENDIAYYLFIEDPQVPADLTGYDVIYETTVQLDVPKKAYLIKLK